MSKQLIFMAAATLLGTLGVAAWTPTVGVVVYHLFAVLRPQFIWEWSLPPGVAWSWYVAICVLLAAAAHLLQGGRVPFTTAHAFTYLFGLWIGVTTFTARSVEAAWPVSMDYFKIFLMYFASSLFLTTPRAVAAVYVAVALSLGYIAYEVNFLYLAYGYLGIYRNGYCGLDNNGAGLMLAMGVPMCFFAWQAYRGWWRWLFAALVPVLLHAVLMTYSRGAMVSLILCTPVLLLRTRSRGWTVAGLVVIAAMVPAMAGDQIRERFFSTAQYEADGSAQSRFGSWAAAFQMACDNPVFGFGVRNSNLFSYQYGADMEGRTIHSQYLQIAADNGFVGTFLYVMMLWTAWRGLTSARRDFLARGDDPEAERSAVLAGGLEAAMVVFAVGSAFLSLEVFELPYILLMLCAQYRDVASLPAAVPEPAPTAAAAAPA